MSSTFVLLLALLALLFPAVGCGPDREQNFWSVEGRVLDLSGNPIAGATVGVDIDRPEMECCPTSHWCLCGFERNFSATTDADGYYLVCLEQAAVRTTILVEMPGYSAPRPYADFPRTEASEAVEDREFWFHGGQFRTIEGYVRHPDGSPWTDTGWIVTIAETQGRWSDLEWTDSAHYAFRVPECDLTFNVRGPGGCGGWLQTRRYEGVNRDFHDQDFITGCPGLQPEEYEVYSDLIQAEFVGHAPHMVPQIYLLDRTDVFDFESDPSGHIAYIQREMPGVTDGMAADFVARNAATYPLENRFGLTVPVTLLSPEVWHNTSTKLAISRVGFNAAMDKALVYVGSYCGSWCGVGYYYLLTKSQGVWSIEDKVLAWIS